MGKKNKNTMRFQLIDNTRQDAYNETCKMEKVWYGEESDGQTMSLESYYCMCKEFAAAMGFAEKSINEWFGDY